MSNLTLDSWDIFFNLDLRKTHKFPSIKWKVFLKKENMLVDRAMESRQIYWPLFKMKH